MKRGLRVSRSFLRWLAATVSLLAAFEASATDTYAGGRLTIPSLTIGAATYSNVVVTPLTILGVAGGTPAASADSYDPVSNQLSIPLVTYAGTPYSNVRITVGSLVSIGGVTGADTYTGTELVIGSVQLPSGMTYQNVAITVGSIVTIGGGMPHAVRDTYDPTSHQLTIAAVTAGGRVYTNVVVTVGSIISAGGQPLREQVLHSFALDGKDAASPVAGLVQGTDGNFYGTTISGGANALGTVFRVTPAGVTTVIYSFSFLKNDGSVPAAGLLQASDGNFYGTTTSGGANAQGTVFQITPAGLEKVIYSFGGNTLNPGNHDGAQPKAALIEAADGYLYGTTSAGGATNQGTVFRLSFAGAETVVYPFGAAGSGVAPLGALVQGADGNLYGTTSGTGTQGGTVFRLTTTGGLTVLHTFTGAGGTAATSDGASPHGGLVLAADGNFYGTTAFGGTNNGGCVYRLTPNGTVTLIYSFSGGGLVSGSQDGEKPYGNLIQASDGNLYGTTVDGGTANAGTVFRVSLSGQEAVLSSFTGAPGMAGLDGALPVAGVVEGSDGNLYGTTQDGGTGGYGTVFRVTTALAP